ncbi:hypothetical protein [Prosthecobacter vanneervenii]|uniref:Tox-HNH-HHH domain-containing protein n=1 Tax=Prosthecobacter vanneervenii TaxID=48466 RepID=A0A7W7YG98_9BACT|nr:hypothetical protein [Prosthecobacter vanneervenii]MBB5035457.1 hypothetical protein [Prosthecobacter vanneervenii]
MRPSTPPLSVADSQKLIENVSKMPPEAQQNPKVQADRKQAEQVVEEYAATSGKQANPEAAAPSEPQSKIPANTTNDAEGKPAADSGGATQTSTSSDKPATAPGYAASSSSNPPANAASGPQPPTSNSGITGPAAKKTKKSNTTSKGVKRNNPKDWKDTMKLWDAVGYQDLLSPANRVLIQNELVPIVDDAWIKVHPEDAGLKGEKISIHHVQGLPLNVPLPYSRHKDAHKPGGFRYNPGGVGSQLPVYSA